MKHYHAHIYWQDQFERAIALGLRERLADIGGRLGSVHDRTIGPHPMPMYQVEYDEQSQAAIESLLKDNAGELSILLHDDTGKHERDHTDGARWIGKPLELDIEFLRALEHD